MQLRNSVLSNSYEHSFHYLLTLMKPQTHVLFIQVQTYYFLFSRHFYYIKTEPLTETSITQFFVFMCIQFI
jgi:hypothetical protein